MPRLVIHQEKIPDPRALAALCPFGALEEREGRVSVNAACKMCRICVKKGPAGAVEYLEDAPAPAVDKAAWQGVAVYVDHVDGRVHPVTLELIGKARELAAKADQPVYALFIGENVAGSARELLHYGVDRVFVYDDPALARFRIEPYANVFEDFVKAERPAAILVGATPVGRQLAPRVAARLHTGLTADCTVLDMLENTDLIQIRPAFGGNIIATIVNPDNRPQMATVREGVMRREYAAKPGAGEVKKIQWQKFVKDADLAVKIIDREIAESKIDIKGAGVIVAGGYGMGSKENFDLVFELADVLGAEVGASRAAVDAGFADHARQVGQTGVTVRPKLYIACGISGQIQHTAGMDGSAMVISINTDPEAPINKIADYAITGDVNEVIPKMIKYYKQNSK